MHTSLSKNVQHKVVVVQYFVASVHLHSRSKCHVFFSGTGIGNQITIFSSETFTEVPPHTWNPYPPSHSSPPPSKKKIGSTSHVSLLYVDVQCNDMVIKKRKKKAIKKFEHFINGSNITFSSMSVVSVEVSVLGVEGEGGTCIHSRVFPNSTHWLWYLCEFSCAASASFKQTKKEQQQQQNSATCIQTC